MKDNNFNKVCPSGNVMIDGYKGIVPPYEEEEREDEDKEGGKK